MKKQVLSMVLAGTLAVPTSAAGVEFTDVPSSHWAHSSISEMADKGVVSGTGNNKYSPDLTVSYAQFATMIARSFYNDQIEDGGDKWYSSFMDTVEKVGALEGTKVLDNDSLVETGINRYEMAQVMYNVMSQKGVTIPNNFDTSKIGDWSSIPANYQKAVSACYSLGTLSGTDSKGTFSGTTMMTRAQAAVVMDRLLEVCNGGTPTTPVVPEKPGEIPAGATHITTRDQLTSQQGFTISNGVFHSDGTGSAGSVSQMRVDTNDYNTLTFTVQALDRDVQVAVGHKGRSQGYFESGITESLGVVKSGTSQTFTINCSTYKWLEIQPGDYRKMVEYEGTTTGVAVYLVECYISDIYLY
ncbi:S-layer homology domain-containing protein [Intestinimonas sp.]|uniref:S-layer homology domain-containing protein n=1 Tax=Intestinimonas sp. TaxID=1965293 RepID=UPI0026200F43|nr:S-layer homology domain-containing protein [Intestinimonas sp.]